MLIDAFMIGWEWDILELRLHELGDIVDKFVIVESKEMHGSNAAKEETLQDHWSIIKPFEEKIHYVLLDHLEPAFDKSTSWLRENYHRNQLMPAILQVSKSPLDIVMISDCDEIPRASMLDEPNHLKAACGALGLMGSRQDMFYYDTTNYVGEWHGTVIGTLKTIEDVGGPQAARNKRDNLLMIDNCGWHFSYFGGLDRVKYKVRNFAHAQEDSCQLLQHRSDEELAEDIRTGRDLYHRPEELKQPRRPDDYRLPKYLLDNRDKFKHFEAAI